MDGKDYCMMDWKTILADVDDDYLIGLSNKGIVKRAYKDKEEGTAQIESVAENAVIKTGEEQVTVVFPLGESRCTCPSRSICRHVVQAILVLKEHMAASGEAVETPAEDTAGKEEADAAHSRVQEEIKAYPLVPLKKVLGARGVNRFISMVKSNLKPDITYSSIITVKMPEQENVVKLLSPLEHSTCSCHKKELCVHKAAAILWCQIDAGILSPEVLFEESMELPDMNMTEIRETAAQMKEFLEGLLHTGLSRTPPDVLDSMERLAIISHNAGLARFEGYFRALADSYERYFMRKATLRTRELMEQTARLYMRVQELLQVQDSSQAARLAGEFRAEYEPVGNLDLIGVAIEHFSSKTGYEGETVYFLEEHTKEWYTYTNARPVFYETGKKRRVSERGQAPWGLSMELKDMVNVRLHLTGARCDSRRRLSATQETAAEVTGVQPLSMEDIDKWYYNDFGKLFANQVNRQRRLWLVEQEEQEGVELVFVQPHSLIQSEFSRTDQQLSLPLVDEAGRMLMVEVTYSKEEAYTIRYLERIAERKTPCFLGRVYLRDGRIRMYPVALFDGKELVDGKE